MNRVNDMVRALGGRERRTFLSLTSPQRIQAYLDSIEYCSDDEYSCPVTLMKTGRGCCFEGALLAAAAFRRLGFDPLILEMTAVRDDDHILAVYRRNGCWGAVAKSNFVGLRAREPVYRCVRELVMSYFDFFFNLQGEKSMRAYSLPLDLARLDTLDWMTSESGLETVVEALERRPHMRPATRGMIRRFTRVDGWTFTALTVGTDASKAYQGAGRPPRASPSMP